jgi:hypothetical protein
MTMKWLGAIALVGVVMSTDSSALETHTVSGKAYEGEHPTNLERLTPLYSVSLVTEKGPGIDRLRVTNTDERGRQFFIQTIDFDGDSPRTYSFSNSAAQQSGKLWVTAGELIMELTEDGRTRTIRSPRPAVFAVGPSISRIIERHIGEIAAGKAFALKMAAVNRLQIFALRVMREPNQADDPIAQVRSGEWLRLRTEPESAVARMFAPKITSIVDTRSGRTLLVVGPLPSPVGGAGILKKGTIRYLDN